MLRRTEAAHYVNCVAWVGARFAHKVRSPGSRNRRGGGRSSGGAGGGGAVVEGETELLAFEKNAHLGFLLNGSRGNGLRVWRPRS